MKKIRKRLYGIDLSARGTHICEHRDCLNDGTQCDLNYYDHEDDYRYKGCSRYRYSAEHRSKNGFCSYCGECWNGCEVSDVEPTDCCSDCGDQFKSDSPEIPKPKWNER